MPLAKREYDGRINHGHNALFDRSTRYKDEPILDTPDEAEDYRNATDLLEEAAVMAVW